MRKYTSILYSAFATVIGCIMLTILVFLSILHCTAFKVEYLLSIPLNVCSSLAKKAAVVPMSAKLCCLGMHRCFYICRATTSHTYNLVSRSTNPGT